METVTIKEVNYLGVILGKMATLSKRILTPNMVGNALGSSISVFLER